MEEKFETQSVVERRKGSTNVVVVLIIAIIVSFVSSSFTYVLVKKNLTNGEQVIYTGDGSQSNVTYKIESTDSPVVAIAAKASPSIVGVSVSYVRQTIYGLSNVASEGSGIIYKKDGYIITNYHVIEGCINQSNTEIKVTTLSDGKEYLASVVGYDATTDLAVLKIDANNLTAAEIGSSTNLKVGELVVAIGNPLGKRFAGTVTVGYVSALNRQIVADGRTYNVLQTDAAINNGNSGGALVNSKGEVIGINTVKVASEGVEGLGFAIPIDEAVPIIDTLIKDGSIKRPYFGISGFDLSEASAQYYGLVKGIYVSEVIAGKSADIAGIKSGDIIVGMDGEEIYTMEELNEKKLKHEVGDKVIVKVYRNKEYVDIELTLGTE